MQESGSTISQSMFGAMSANEYIIVSGLKFLLGVVVVIVLGVVVVFGPWGGGALGKGKRKLCR